MRTIPADSTQRRGATAKRPRRRARPPAGKKAPPRRPDGLGWSVPQFLEALFCFGPLWGKAGDFEAEIAAAVRGRPGRRKRYQIVQMLAVDCAEQTCGSARAVIRELEDPVTWRRLRLAVEAAWPDRPERRLAYRPISRSQYLRGRDRYLETDDGRHKAWTDATAVRVGRWMGMLAGGSRTHPETCDVVYGDGSWVNALCGADPRTAAPGRRFDPDAVAYHKNRQSGVGRQWIVTLFRNPHRGERIIASISPQQARHSTDADTFAEDIARLRRDCPGFAEGAVGACYDGAMHAKPRMALHDLGIVPIDKTRRNAPTVRLGARTVKLPDGTETGIDLFAVDGTPAIAVSGGRGRHHLKLRRTKTHIRPNRNAPGALYNDWTIPHHPLAAHLAGGTVTIRHNPADPDEHLKLAKALRVIPPSDPDFARLYSVRADVESTNHHIKQALPDKRARTIGLKRQQLNHNGYQIHCIITALAHWHKRTGGDLTPWFGQHQPP